jgi:hypothetical protein
MVIPTAPYPDKEFGTPSGSLVRRSLLHAVIVFGGWSTNSVWCAVQAVWYRVNLNHDCVILMFAKELYNASLIIWQMW